MAYQFYPEHAVKWRVPFKHIDSYTDLINILPNIESIIDGILMYVEFEDSFLQAKQKPIIVNIPLRNGGVVNYINPESMDIKHLTDVIHKLFLPNDTALVYRKKYPQLYEHFAQHMRELIHPIVINIIRDYDDIEDDDGELVDYLLEIEDREDQTHTTTRLLRIIGLQADASYSWQQMRNALYMYDKERIHDLYRLYPDDFVSKRLCILIEHLKQYESVMFHEFTSSMFKGKASDKPYHKTYGSPNLESKSPMPL